LGAWHEICATNQAEKLKGKKGEKAMKRFLTVIVAGGALILLVGARKNVSRVIT